MTDIVQAVKVHISGSDVPLHAPATDAARKKVHTSMATFSIAKNVVNGAPALLLPHAPNRLRASLVFTGTAGETVVIAGSAGEAFNGIGAILGPLSAPLVLEGDDEVWLGQVGAGVSMVVGVIAEYC